MEGTERAGTTVSNADCSSGRLDALRKVDVGAQVSGQLKTLSVEIGDKVKKGQLLGVIDPEQAQNQIREVEATLMELRAQRAQAQAERNLAQVTLTRQQAKRRPSRNRIWTQPPRNWR